VQTAARAAFGNLSAIKQDTVTIESKITVTGKLELLRSLLLAALPR
jgi:hypothetical protein